MAGKYLAPRKNTPGCRPKGGDPIRDKRRKIITIALAVLFFLLALGLTVYPIFSSRYNAVVMQGCLDAGISPQQFYDADEKYRKAYKARAAPVPKKHAPER